MGRCIFFDSEAQTILLHKHVDDELLYVDHKTWAVQIDIKEFNKLKAAATTAMIFSPFSYLYDKYKDINEPALYGLILDEYCYFVIFLENDPLFWYICKADEDISESLQILLKSFYDSPQSFFIEKIYLFNFSKTLEPNKEEVEERLLLPVEIIKKDENNLCKELSSSDVIRMENETTSFWKKYRTLLFIATATLAMIGIYDIYLRYTIHKYEKEIEKFVQKQVNVANKNNNYHVELMKFQKLKPIVEKIKQKNAFFASRIRSIFDLIPNDAYLTKAEINENSLMFEGFCKSKEHLLQSFHEKMANNFQKERINFSRAKDEYAFQALYEEMIHAES